MENKKIDYNSPEASLKSIAWHVKGIDESLKIIAESITNKPSSSEYNKSDSPFKRN
jgi:hypothetical protein